MNDINYILNLLNENRISASQYASGIGTSRQNVQHWTKSESGIPKKFLLPTIDFIKKNTGKKIKLENLLSYLHQDSTSKRQKKSNTSQKCEG